MSSMRPRDDAPPAFMSSNGDDATPSRCKRAYVFAHTPEYLVFGDVDEGADAYAAGRAGDVYLLHPMLVHSASISCTGAPRAILNLPLPYGQAKLAQKHGSLCGVTLPILHAAALRHRTPRALLSVLWCAA